MANADNVNEGVHNYSPEDLYVPPEDPVLQERLEWFQDQKLALMMHWGIYSQPGIVESWALIDEDQEWSRNEIDWTSDIDRFKDEYVALNKTFNPIRFRPDRWASFAREIGFRYLIFTTKHHDGFCMWDTKTTDYRITGPDSPFKVDIVKEVFDAFRREGLAIAAYFSKADWNTPYYWKPGALHGFTSRGPSYDPAEDPGTWEKFVRFTHEQIEELEHNYGPLDILWLDAGWVRTSNGQDIRLGELVDRLRLRNPGLLSADRTVGGPYENYITPEQTIPEQVLRVPWESCITLGRAFSFRYEDHYKSARNIAGLLLKIISRGGNLALNVAPQPDGRLPRGAMQNLKEFSLWLHTHEQGIFETRPVAPYAADDFFFTRNRRTGAVYAFRFYEEDNARSASEYLIPYSGAVKKITCLETGQDLAFETTDRGILVRPTDLPQNPITVSFELIPE